MINCNYCGNEIDEANKWREYCGEFSCLYDPLEVLLAAGRNAILLCDQINGDMREAKGNFEMALAGRKIA